jgi:hypothetical protein
MAYYPQYPAFYAYPVPYPSQEFYAMYPPAPINPSGHVYYQGSILQSFISARKFSDKVSSL